MGLLSRSSAALAAALGLGLAAGCMFLEALGGGPEVFAFSHDLHVTGEGLDCVSCHESAMVAAEAGMPGPDACSVCHDELDTGAAPERRVAALFDGPAFRAAFASRLDDELVFDHLAHVSYVTDCAACHTGIATNDVIDASIAVDMAACERCHAERQAPNECATCHREITRDWRPPDHAFDWKRLHGRACKRDDPPALQDCALCHEESSCAACHRVEEPQSHDHFFRLRGHGFLAAMDRTSCATCHEPATCDRCHAENEPLSHSPATFGGTRSNHCLTCHFPLEGEGCAVCHQATPSHALGSPKPDWHTPAMDCRSCHGLSLPLSHADDGSNCNLCHP